MILYCFWRFLSSGTLNSLNRNSCFLDWCCFQFLKFIPFGNSTIFVECVFPSALCFISHGFKYEPWQFRGIVLCCILHFLFQVLRSSYLKILRSFSVIFLPRIHVCIWGTRRFSVEIVLYMFFLDTFCFDFFVFAGGRRLFRNCMSALHCLNFFLFENPYRPLQYSLSRPFSEDWFPEGSLFAWTLKYFNCKGIFIEFPSSL